MQQSQLTDCDYKAEAPEKPERSTHRLRRASQLTVPLSGIEGTIQMGFTYLKNVSGQGQNPALAGFCVPNHPYVLQIAVPGAHL
jgi:hypothetical protein